MSVYDIVIAGVTAAAPSDGFIDPVNVYRYTSLNPNDKPTTFVLSKAKSRANRRYKTLVNTIMNTSALRITNTTVGGSPNANTAPTSLTVRVEVQSISTPDENNVGQTLTGVAAVRRIAARALVRTETVVLEILDPTESATPGNATLFARTGPRFEETVVGPLYASLTLAEAGITVNTIS